MRRLKILKSITNRKTASLDKYLQEVSKEAMISQDEEVELAREIKKGNKAALEKLVRANLRFVISVAKQYRNQGLSLPDLINEGNLGLIKAAAKFDETKGFKFISYAVWWIRQAILQATAEKSRTVRIPINQKARMSMINKIQATFEQKNERQATILELSELLELSKDKIITSIIASNPQVYLDAPVKNDEDSNLLDIIANKNSLRADIELEKESLIQEIERTLAFLSHKESLILRLFYGINTKEKSLEEISMETGLSGDRIRQIKERAIKRLRRSSLVKILRTYL